MSQPPVTVGPAEPFKRCLDLMRVQEVSALPVVTRGGELLGIVSEADLMKRFCSGAGPLSAEDMMTSDVATIESGASLAAAARLMLLRNVKRLPVLDRSGRVIGVCSRSDVLRVFLRSDEAIRKDVAGGLLNELPLLGRGRVKVDVADGVVRLSGEVESGPLTGLLLRLVAAVPGVVGVENRMQTAQPVANHV